MAPTSDVFEQKIEALEKEVAELKQAENKQGFVNRLFNSIIQDSPVFLLVLNPEGGIRLMNDRMLGFLECTIDEVAGEDYLSNFVPDDDKAAVAEACEQLLRSNHPTVNSNHVVSKKGAKLLLEWHGRQMFDDQNELDCLWFLGIGITIRKKTEEELAMSEEKLNSIIRTVPDVIYRLDPEGRVNFVSDSIKQYGYEPEALIGELLLDIVHSEDKKKAQYRINERRTGGRGTKALEIRLMRKNQGTGAYGYFLISTEGLYTSSRPSARSFIGTQGIARDISGQKRADAERLHREKLQGVIEMAGAICHELNQPLMAISGYAQLISMAVEDTDPLVDKIEKVMDQINKLKEITQKLMKITKYETKDYLESKIIDIDKAAR